MLNFWGTDIDLLSSCLVVKSRRPVVYSPNIVSSSAQLIKVYWTVELSYGSYDNGYRLLLNIDITSHERPFVLFLELPHVADDYFHRHVVVLQSQCSVLSALRFGQGSHIGVPWVLFEATFSRILTPNMYGTPMFNHATHYDEKRRWAINWHT